MRRGPKNWWYRAAGAASALGAGLGASAVPAVAAEPVVATLGEESAGLDAGCVQGSELTRETEQFVGRKVFGPREDADVVVVLDVRTPDSARITLYDPEHRPLGRRAIEAQSCTELTQGLALALSLMLDFTTEDVERLRESEAAANNAAEPTPAPPPSTTATAASPTSTPVEPPPTVNPKRAEPTLRKPSEQRSRGGLQLGADGRAGLGFAPVPVWGVGARVGLELAGDWFLELHGVYWVPREFRRADGRVEYRAVEGGLDVYPFVLELGATRTRVGGVGAASRVLLAGSGYDETASGGAWTLRTGLVSRLEVEVGPLLAELAAQLETPLVGHRAVAASDTGPREQFRVSPVIFTLGAGVAVPLR